VSDTHDDSEGQAAQPTVARPVPADEAMAEATRVEGSARVAEVHREVAETDARRAEEERSKAEEESEKLSRKERKAREKADKAAQEALDERAKAQEAERLALESARQAPDAGAQPTRTSSASVVSPGVGSTSAPRAAASAAAPKALGAAPSPDGGGGEVPLTERPEVIAGAAFAGAFLFARILRAITSDD